MLLVSVDPNALPRWRSKRSATTRSGTFGRSAPRHEDGCGNGEKDRLTRKELEDFKINELAKAKADFQAQAPWDTNGRVHAQRSMKNASRKTDQDAPLSILVGSPFLVCTMHVGALLKAENTAAQQSSKPG